MKATRLGIDLGSVAAHAALLDAKGEVLWSASLALAGRPIEALKKLLATIPEQHLAQKVHSAVTGSGRGLTDLPGCVPINDMVATARGAAALAPSSRGVIEIGGHMSRWIALDGDGRGDMVDFALSNLCAAGAGVFLEQQAGRLQLTITELASLAATAPRGATVAGRCAVFAKSDMIHLQQKGTSVAEIAYGLCLALARSFESSVMRGKELLRPTLLVGGGASNAGLVRAIHEILHFEDGELLIRPEHTEVGAIGAALLSADGEQHQLAEILHHLGSSGHRERNLRRLPPLPDPDLEPPLPEPQGELEQDEPHLLGVDVGSVSTKLVLLDRQGKPVDTVYLATRGQPLVVLQEGLAILAKRSTLNIVGVGTTGSGRHLAGRFLGADLVRNEITAQLRAAAQFLPSIDTVLEIGGQDSKYISASNGHIVDFTMNRVCAAGTGSFLEEQAERLGIDIIDEFAKLALAAKAPIDLGSRCTVFMDSELANGIRSGAKTEDLAAGLAISVARNYLDKVVAGRPIGENVLFQGGTACNRAVVAAFGQLLGRRIAVHPYNRLSGAIGAALLLRDARLATTITDVTAFRGVDACRGEQETSFECRKCSNMCQVNRFRSTDQVFFFGDICERYSTRGVSIKDAGEHALALRQRWLLEESGLDLERATEIPQSNYCLGIPRASVGFHLLPLWTALARAAGRQPVLSPPSSPAVLATAQRHLRADTCLPIKMVYGHIENLRQQGVKEILLPAVVTMPKTLTGDTVTETCPFTQ
ncbi:MAG: hypothetical protein HN348_11095, partial [Proteobacteria bacterium]|nr:hypothetical protein [Pseudomonadota bacterium]